MAYNINNNNNKKKNNSFYKIANMYTVLKVFSVKTNSIEKCMYKMFNKIHKCVPKTLNN